MLSEEKTDTGFALIPAIYLFFLTVTIEPQLSFGWVKVSQQALVCFPFVTSGQAMAVFCGLWHKWVEDSHIPEKCKHKS